MKLRKLFFGVAALAASLNIMPAIAADKPITIKYGAFHSPNESFIKVITKMTENITQRTDGRVRFEMYYGGSLLKAADLYPGMARGAADMVSSVPHAFNAREFPLSGVTLPFTTDNVPAATIAWQEWYKQSPEVQQEFKRNRAHLLLAWPAPENVLWTQKEVNKAEDLKGMRIRMLLGPGEALSILGATAVATPYTESIELLQRGGVEGITTTFFEQGVRDGLGDIANYLSSAAKMGVFAVNLTSIRADLWEELPADIKAVFEDEASKATQAYFEELEQANMKAAEMLLSAKRAKVTELDPEEEQRWRDLTEQELHAAYIERAKRVKADGAALIARYKDLVAKYSNEYQYKTGIELYQELVKAKKQ